jgi:ribulose-5-phosphate 4-epimerase/fuculose-1-phosphate aldolase
MRKHQRPLRMVLLENHGIINLGRTAEAVLVAMLMAEKAAGTLVGAAAPVGPTFMSLKQVARVVARPNEG